MLVPLVILVVAAAIILGRVPFAKAAGRLAAGAVLVSVALPCLLYCLSKTSFGGIGHGLSSAAVGVVVVLLAILVLALLGRWSFKRWLARKPEAPTPASSRRRVDLPELERGRSFRFYEEDDL
jgi:hypothetical protein